jgi:hypothetical protein
MGLDPRFLAGGKGTLGLVSQSGALDRTISVAAKGSATEILVPRRTYGLLNGL